MLKDIIEDPGDFQSFRTLSLAALFHHNPDLRLEAVAVLGEFFDGRLRRGFVSDGGVYLTLRAMGGGYETYYVAAAENSECFPFNMDSN